MPPAVCRHRHQCPRPIPQPESPASTRVAAMPWPRPSRGVAQYPSTKRTSEVVSAHSDKDASGESSMASWAGGPARYAAVGALAGSRGRDRGTQEEAPSLSASGGPGPVFWDNRQPLPRPRQAGRPITPICTASGRKRRSQRSSVARNAIFACRMEIVSYETISILSFKGTDTRIWQCLDLRVLWLTNRLLFRGEMAWSI